MMEFFPQQPNLDAEGNDLNGIPSLNMLAITARLNLTIQGPDVLGAKVKGFIEGDFTGATDPTINMLRLRHGYLLMDWSKANVKGKRGGELLMGQYWYPMVVQEVMPEVQPLNTGAPFHPYARYNQVRYSHHLGHWTLFGVAAFQLDNKSQGPQGSSTLYLRSSCIPELHAQLQYRNGAFFAGAAANYTCIQPRNYITDYAAQNYYLTNQTFVHTTFSAFLRYNWTNWTLKAQTLLSDNLYEGCTMGGYLELDQPYFDESSLNYIHDYSYRPFTYTTAWMDLGKSKGTWRPGVFLGYAKNNNFGENFSINETAYGRGYNIDYLYRIQPRLGYYAGNGLSFHAEIEYTFAQYGEKITDHLQPDMHRYHYEAKPELGVGNLRCILGAVYAF